jgi:RHS repeat-associated protein
MIALRIVLMAEYGGPAQTAATHYFTTDYLGSTRMILNRTGGCLERLDYAPFGGQISRSGYECYGSASNEKPLFTGQMRDGESTAGTETGLDYFGARYLWAAVGRFVSADPLFFQKDMLADPQLFNLYGYARNNPLRFIDPTGQRIELTGETKEERIRQLAAIQATVGAEAGALLRIEQDEETGVYFVSIIGGVEAFSSINPAASDFATIIKRDEVAKFSLVASKERLDMGDGKEYTLSGLGASGATARDTSGQLWVFVRRPEEGYSWDFFKSDHWWTILFNNVATVTGHECGHAREHMKAKLRGGVPTADESNSGSLELENKVRRLQGGPNAPLVRKH